MCCLRLAALLYSLSFSLSNSASFPLSLYSKHISIMVWRPTLPNLASSPLFFTVDTHQKNSCTPNSISLFACSKRPKLTDWLNMYEIHLGWETWSGGRWCLRKIAVWARGPKIFLKLNCHGLKLFLKVNIFNWVQNVFSCMQKYS